MSVDVGCEIAVIVGKTPIAPGHWTVRPFVEGDMGIKGSSIAERLAASQPYILLEPGNMTLKVGFKTGLTGKLLVAFRH